jgi:hypothetical protein
MNKNKPSKKPAQAGCKLSLPPVQLDSCLAYSSPSKMGVICFPETSGSLHSHRRENLNSSSISMIPKTKMQRIYANISKYVFEKERVPSL